MSYKHAYLHQFDRCNEKKDLNVRYDKVFFFRRTKHSEWNSMVMIHGTKHRARSEALIIKGNKILLAFYKDTKHYQVPGGGWEPDEDHSVAAQREANEEVRIKTKDPIYAGNYVSHLDHVEPGVMKYVEPKYWWKDFYTEVFVCEYAGEYTDYIAPKDRDNMIKYARWYDINEVYDMLKPMHKIAVDKWRRGLL